MKNRVIGNTKKCGRCQEYKDFSLYHRDTNNLGHGCASYCKTCALEQRRENAVKYNIARKIRQSGQEFKDINNARNRAKIDKNPAIQLLGSAKQRSKELGWFCDLEASDIVIPEFCPILGEKLKRRTRYAPSLDRIDSSKGYIKGNIIIVSRQVNVMKNDATILELLKFCQNAPSFYSKFY